MPVMKFSWLLLLFFVFVVVIVRSGLKKECMDREKALDVAHMERLDFAKHTKTSSRFNKWTTTTTTMVVHALDSHNRQASAV